MGLGSGSFAIIDGQLVDTSNSKLQDAAKSMCALLKLFGMQAHVLGGDAVISIIPETGSKHHYSVHMLRWL